MLSTRERAKGVVASALILVVCHGSAAYARDAQDLLAAYTLKTWVGTDGFSFGDTNAIAQDAVGYLWVGTSLGLVRFDGVRFVPWRTEGVPLDTFVTALYASSDGSLWVGLTTGIVRIRNEEATLYAAREGFRGDLVGRIVEDRDKTIWASGAAGVWRFRDEHWEQISASRGLPPRASSALFLDRDGALWVGSAEGIYRRPAGADTFEHVVATSSTVRAIVGDSAGSLWATDPLRTLTAVSVAGSERARPTYRGLDLRGSPGQGFGAASDVLLDRRGNMWVATFGQGLLRARRRGHSYEAPEQITRREGLAANSVRALFEDREGNIWIGTAGGLTRLSEKRMTSIAEGETVSALAATSDGSVWVGTNSALIRLSDGGQRRYTASDGLPGATIRSLHAERDGTLWVATNRGLARLVGGRFVPVHLPEGTLLQRTTSMTTDREGALWLSDLDDGLFRFAEDMLTNVDAPGVQRPMTVYSDRAGRVWIGQLSGDLAVYENSRLAFYSTADGSEIGTVTAIYEDRHGTVWVGATTGLGRVDNGHFVREDIENLASGVLAIVEDAHNRLWIATRDGILCASFSEPAQAGANSPRLTDFLVYDASDGLPGVPVRALPGVVRGTDGSLSFATANAVARIVPERLIDSGPTPRIRIEAVVADERQLRPEPQALLPPGTSRIEIQYTVLTLTAAANSRFLYRLDGYDLDWVRAGLRREAVYTNLPPGQYRFRVTSRGGGGPRQEAAWDFTIEPKFYQTRSFAVVMGGFVILLVSAAWRVRLLHVRNQFKVVLSERARIAREIHDTLLQGLFGVALQIDGVSKQLESSPESTKERLESVRRLIGRYIRETRSSIWLLRSPSLEERDLPAAIRDASEMLTAGTPVQLDFEVTGHVRPLSSELEEQLLRIVHEAVMNVVTHAQATKLQILLQYPPRAVSLRVSDNGCGFDPERPSSEDSGKWGLIGMKERATQVGAALNLSSVRGRGTEIELVVPTNAVA